MTDWVRLWHDMPTDPKWRTIARKAGQRVGDVIAVFNFVMVNAGTNAAERGAMIGFDPEDVATALDLDEADVLAILSAMQGKVLDGDKLTGWEKRQPKREDGTAAQRKAAWKNKRDAERNGAGNASERIGTHRNAPDAESETDIPLANANGPEPDSDKEFWDGAKTYLGKGKSGLIGKWIRQHGKSDTARAITAAQLERAVDPPAYIEGYFRKKRTTESRAFEMPC